MAESSTETGALIPVPAKLKEELLDIRNADTTKLAYIGDAVYEIFVRTKAAEVCGRKALGMNKFSVHYVKADSQALAAKILMDEFADEEELALMKRARNRTNTSHSRGTTEKAYKLATGFEALIGWLYIKGDTERLVAAVESAMHAVDCESQK